MPVYVSLPIEIEATQFVAKGAATVFPLGMHKWPDEFGVTPRNMSWGYVQTANGNIAHVWDGDYVIKEPDGRGYYPCKADIFASRYKLKE